VILHWQFNDGMGWRGGAALEADDVESVIEAAKSHFERWPNDHLRIMKKTGPDEYAMIWWQDGAQAEERRSNGI